MERYSMRGEDMSKSTGEGWMMMNVACSQEIKDKATRGKGVCFGAFGTKLALVTPVPVPMLTVDIAAQSQLFPTEPPEVSKSSLLELP